MATLIWDQVGERVYEGGLDRGVLYTTFGRAIPWNGLKSVTEKFDKETTPVYFDGLKIAMLVSPGDFSASLKAITYPDEFLDFEGVGVLRTGFYLGDQKPRTFSLSYRVHVGDDINGEKAGYKIHILYNLTAIPSDKAYASFSNVAAITEFEWTVTAIPSEISGYRPTAHIILDSREMDAALLADIERMLYGNDISEANLPTIYDLVDYIEANFPVAVFDNGDGTWTFTTNDPGMIIVDVDGLFEINNITAVYLDATTYQI